MLGQIFHVQFMILNYLQSVPLMSNCFIYPTELSSNLGIKL